MAPTYLIEKNGTFHFRIVIPKHKRPNFGTGEIRRTLKTKDRKEAIIKCAPLLDYFSKLFKASEGIPTPDAITLSQLKEVALNLGATYHSAEEIHAAPIQDAVAMLSQAVAALNLIKKPDKTEVAALGGVIGDSLSLDQMFARYQELAAGKWSDLDHRESQKKWNRYREPVDDFKREMGDLDILKIQPKDAANYAINLGKRIEAGRLKSETAKKKLLFLNAMVRKVFKTDYPERTNPFEEAEIEHNGNDKGQRRPFTESEIVALRKKLSESKANDELKAILQIIEYTGTSAKEIVLLHETDFHLDGEIPFVRIGKNPNRKSLKTENRPRDIPLVGAALEAAKRFRKGFHRYCRSNGSEALSGAANKLIKQVAADATTYSYRHRFIDLLREVDGMQDSLLKSIIGHDGTMTGGYGDGYSLARKRDAIQNAMKIAEEKQKKPTNSNQTWAE
ncbi:DUF6538 domain-containing protein [Sinorhizobium fredii]|uniref:DUF6538 domain-containing protein n=1 Tax=Rhizobium fredii TaxID=380 RepID=UPI0035140EFB